MRRGVYSRANIDAGAVSKGAAAGDVTHHPPTPVEARRMPFSQRSSSEGPAKWRRQRVTAIPSPTTQGATKWTAKHALREQAQQLFAGPGAGNRDYWSSLQVSWIVTTAITVIAVATNPQALNHWFVLPVWLCGAMIGTD